MAEPTQMRQLIQNLIANSVRFRSVERPPTVMISGRSGDEFFEFSVNNNGIGFEQEESEQIFGLFQRLHGRSETPGNGLGLAIVSKMVETHGGTIVAQSSPGKGATFTARLPAHRPNSQATIDSADERRSQPLADL